MDFMHDHLAIALERQLRVSGTTHCYRLAIIRQRAQVRKTQDESEGYRLY